MYQGRPRCRRNKIGRIGGTGDGKETCSPGLQIVEVQGRRACYNAIEITRKHVSGFYALTPSKGASEVIGLLISLVIEEVG